MPAVEYMDMLEGEVAALRQQLATLAACPPRPHQQQQQQHLEDGRNDLLEYLKSLEPHTLQVGACPGGWVRGDWGLSEGKGWEGGMLR